MPIDKNDPASGKPWDPKTKELRAAGIVNDPGDPRW